MSKPLRRGTTQLEQQVPEAVRHLRDALLAGKPWQRALLEAMGLWTLPEEEYHGRHYCYMLLGEAFDWLLLAERLCEEVKELAPSEELEMLLLHGRLPQGMGSSQVKGLLGFAKYRALLNFWYGVVVEEALQLAVEEGIRKERRASGLPDGEHFSDLAYQRLYGATREELLQRFCADRGYPRRERMSLTLSQMKEFTYWLFKHRVKCSEPAKVASDTRRALERLRQLRGSVTPF